MAESDPQSKRKRTWGEWLGGTKEGNAIASAEYKRGMGINPKAKEISNAEASRSARSMTNPTSAPARTNKSGNATTTKTTNPPSSTGRKKFWNGGGGSVYQDIDPYRTTKYNQGDYAKYRKDKAATQSAVSSNSDSPAPNKTKTATPKVKPAKADPVKAAAAKPTRMTAFERQKMRQLEKEGWGGRSMTSAQAKSRVETERSYKSPVNGLSFSGKAPSKAPAKAVKGKPLSSTKFSDMLQGRNVKGSPTYSPSGTKKKEGFKFKDLFKKK